MFCRIIRFIVEISCRIPKLPSETKYLAAFFAELRNFLSRSLAELQDLLKKSDFALLLQSHVNRALLTKGSV